MTQILRRQKTMTRAVCPQCDEGIRQGQEFVTIDHRPHHLYCASDAGMVPTCPECFFFYDDCECER